MSRPRGAEILGVGMVTSLGLNAATTAAAVRAGLSRFQDSEIQDRHGAPIVMAMVPSAQLPPLHPSLAQDPLMTLRQARMLCLAAGALREALAPVASSARIPLLLSLPEVLPGQEPPTAPRFLQWLRTQTEMDLAWDRSLAFPLGRAGGLAALRDALDRIAPLSDAQVLVGGVDSYVDPELLDALDREGRLRTRGAMDGFTPGEGAGFLLLASRGSAERAGSAPIA